MLSIQAYYLQSHMRIQILVISVTNNGAKRSLSFSSKFLLFNPETNRHTHTHRRWEKLNSINIAVNILEKSQLVFCPSFILFSFFLGFFRDLLKKLSVKAGLIGCFRGLVVNGEILDIYSYMSVHLSEIIKDCKPSCVPNPCKNGAECKELWSTFKCVCNNTWAHIGEFCETSK